MIGPWKRAADLQRENDRLAAKLEAADSERSTLLSMIRKLTETVVEMKREGFVVPDRYGAPADAGEEMDPEIEEAIREFARPGTSLYRELHREAAGMLGGGSDTKTAIEYIRRGGDPRDWEGL